MLHFLLRVFLFYHYQIFIHFNANENILCNFMQNLIKIVCRSVTSDKCFFPFINLRYTSCQVYISLIYRITIHQKESNAAELVDSRTYELHDFKVEGERRKLDLPAQKNLLTNYFCILYKYLALHF